MQSDKRIDKYQFNLRRLLGQGSYASVYFGKVINSSQEVAVKVIDKRIFTSSYNLRSIQSEIDIMKKMRHASIVQLHDVYQTANNMYIITELCDYDLLQELKKERRLDEQMAVAYLKDIVCGVKYLHTMGIIHRDLKPANILIKDGHCKIADFGFAKTLNDSDSMMRSVVGTPLYMSPQLLKRTHYTNKSDIWSIGLIYYEMLHGRTPWVAQNEAQLLQAIHHSRINYSKNISDLSRDFITRCLQLSEQDRMSWE